MKIKGLPTLMLFLLAVTLVVACIPTEAEAAIYEDTVRLHIRARSDSAEDQAVKLEIRDRLLEKYGEYPTPCNKNEAEQVLKERLEEIENDVNLWLVELGCDYTAEVSLGVEWFPTREYEGFTLPAGEYDALIVSLGGGEGQNWWCVMYPPMCLDAAVGNRVYTEEERGLIAGGKYRVRFKLLELAAELTR